MARSALIGALYAILTFAVPFSSGLMQVRLSEALCVLPCFSFSAVPGLFIGCLIGNLLSGAIPLDLLFGSLATLLAALATYFLKKTGISKWLFPLPAVVLNALIVGAVLYGGYRVPFPYWTCVLYVGAGQAIACYGLGMPLYFTLSRFGSRLFQ